MNTILYWGLKLRQIVNTLLSLYKRSKYFIHLAWLDHCPNVVVDARASGLIVIGSTHVPPLVDIVRIVGQVGTRSAVGPMARMSLGALLIIRSLPARMVYGAEVEAKPRLFPNLLTIWRFFGSFQKWGIIGILYWTYNRYAQYIQKMSILKCEKILPVSNSIKDMLIYGGIPKHKVAVIHNPINTNKKILYWWQCQKKVIYNDERSRLK